MLAEGQVIGSYRVVRPIGAGATGAVFEAVHVQIRKRAAIKVLHPEMAAREEMAKRFFNEALAVNIVAHPGMVAVFDHGQLPDGTAYIVMEYLEGTTLADRLGDLDRPMAEADVLRLSRQIASVLSAAHNHKIVHRDLKPANVMIVADPEAPGGERAKVLDFGVAKVAAENLQLGAMEVGTLEGTIFGTPQYMAPEQCAGASSVDDRADVYSLGIMMYEMLTGAVPFFSKSLQEVMAKQMFEAPRLIQESEPGVSQRTGALVHAMLAKKRADRPAMSWVITKLEQLVQSGPLSRTQAEPGDPSDPRALAEGPLLATERLPSVPAQIGPRRTGGNLRLALILGTVVAVAALLSFLVFLRH